MTGCLNRNVCLRIIALITHCTCTHCTSFWCRVFQAFGNYVAKVKEKFGCSHLARSDVNRKCKAAMLCEISELPFFLFFFISNSHVGECAPWLESCFSKDTRQSLRRSIKKRSKSQNHQTDKHYDWSYLLLGHKCGALTVHGVVGEVIRKGFGSIPHWITCDALRDLWKSEQSKRTQLQLHSVGSFSAWITAHVTELKVPSGWWWWSWFLPSWWCILRPSLSPCKDQ